MSRPTGPNGPDHAPDPSYSPVLEPLVAVAPLPTTYGFGWSNSSGSLSKMLLGHLPTLRASPLVVGLGGSLGVEVVSAVVVVAVLVAPHERQVLEPVVGLVPIEVVDDVSGRDGSVGVLPDFPVLEDVLDLSVVSEP